MTDNAKHDFAKHDFAKHDFANPDSIAPDSARRRAVARPYGLAGLLGGFLVMVALTLALFALCLAVAAAGDILLFGFDRFEQGVSDFFSMVETGEKKQVLVPIFALGVLLYGAFVGSCLAVAGFRGGAHWGEVLAWRPFRMDRLAWLLIAAGLIYGVAAGLTVVRLHPEARTWLVLPDDALGLLIAFALIVVMAPLAEELLFRGWLYTGLRARFGFPLTATLTAALFACAHWEKTHIYAAVVLPVGLLLGYLRERTGSVRATIMMHAIYNGFALVEKLLLPD